MSKRIWLLGGVVAPIVYLIAVVLGGLIRPDYSHYSEAISELIASGAPNKALLDPLFVVYNLAALAFSFGVLACVRYWPSGSRRVGLIAAGFVIFGGLIGLATVFFPQDPGGPAVTLTGTIHIVLAGLSSLASMLSMLFFGLWLRSAHESKMARYSLLSLIVVFLSGGLAAASIPIGFGASGLLERVTIFSYLQWMFVVALWLYIQLRPGPERPPASESGTETFRGGHRSSLLGTDEEARVSKHPIESVIERADAAIVSEDFDALMEFYADDAVLVVKPGMIACGKTEIRAASERIAAHFDHSLVVEQAGLKLLEAGDTVLVLAKTIISAGNTPPIERLATYVFRRDSAGKWLCVIDNSYGHQLMEHPETVSG